MTTSSAGRERLIGLTLGGAVAALYLTTFASVPTSDGLSFIASIEAALRSADGRLSIISNAPFSYHLAFALKRLTVALHVPVSTLWVFQGLNAAVTAVGAVVFYRTLRLVGAARFWAVLAALLVVTSYGVWYFANGEVHHVGLAILLFVFYRLVRLRQRRGPSAYVELVALGLLNAVAVFFHQEHFLFGLVAVVLLAWARPWRLAARDIVAYGAAGTLGTMLLIVLVGRMGAGARSVREIVAWYFWQIGYLVTDYQAEPPWVIALRLVKGQLTAFTYGVQVIVDAARAQALWAIPVVRVYAALTVVALLLAAGLVGVLVRGVRRGPAELHAIAAAAIAWLLVYPVTLCWYFPAVTEYYLKTIPPFILLVVLGPIAVERARGANPALRAAGATLLALVVAVNFFAAILPWYRYGRMREAVAADVRARFSPRDLAVSIESGIDAVLADHVEQIAVKDVLYREGKTRGLEVVRQAIAARLAEGHRVLLYNPLPGRWALEGLNDRARNPYRDRYDVADFERFLAELRQRYDLVPTLAYWEAAKEPLYLFGRRMEIGFEIRPHGGVRRPRRRRARLTPRPACLPTA